MTREELLVRRRKDFETVYKLKSPVMRPDGTYKNVYAQTAWNAWNAALDSVEIELPITNFPDGCGDVFEAISIEDMIGSLTRQGYKVSNH